MLWFRERTMMAMRRALCILALLAAAVGSAAAGQAPPATGGRAAQPKPLSEAAPIDEPTISEAELIGMLDAYAIVQAKDQLEIPDDKYATFAARLKKLQDVRRSNQRLRRQIVGQLNRLTMPRAGAAVDDAAIRKQLAALRDHDERSIAELRLAYDSLDEVLDPRQQARFRILEERIEQRKLDLVVRARERARANRRGGG
jgi:hypothetical protein